MNLFWKACNSLVVIFLCFSSITSCTSKALVGKWLKMQFLCLLNSPLSERKLWGERLLSWQKVSRKKLCMLILQAICLQQSCNLALNWRKTIFSNSGKVKYIISSHASSAITMTLSIGGQPNWRLPKIYSWASNVHQLIQLRLVAWSIITRKARQKVEIKAKIAVVGCLCLCLCDSSLLHHEPSMSHECQPLWVWTEPS